MCHECNPQLCNSPASSHSGGEEKRVFPTRSPLKTGKNKIFLTLCCFLARIALRCAAVAHGNTHHFYLASKHMSIYSPSRAALQARRKVAQNRKTCRAKEKLLALRFLLVYKISVVLIYCSVLIQSALLPSEPPPAITVRGNVTVTPGSRAILTCHVVSTVNFNLTWLRAGHDARLDPRVHVLSNLSLQLSTVSPDQSGWYECVAINEGGAAAERIFLTVEGNGSSLCAVAIVCSVLALVSCSDPSA